MPSRTAPYRIFVSGNCQMQLVADALKFLHRGNREILIAYRASRGTIESGDDNPARRCHLHVSQITNFVPDPWLEASPASARHIRAPVLQLPGVFHAFAPRVHPFHETRGRPPYYLTRGNKVLNELAEQHRRGVGIDRLVGEYLAYAGREIESAPRLMELNIAAMRRVGSNSDFDVWRELEPRLAEERFMWSVKHPTLATAMKLLRGVLALIDLPYDARDLEALASGPEFHEPYHAPIHPNVAARLGLAWAGAETKYRFFHSYFTAAEHARVYIGGNFRAEFRLNKAIHQARCRGDAKATVQLFRGVRGRFPDHGQADFWFARVLQRADQYDQAIARYERALRAARDAPHAVLHRADIPIAKIAACLAQCRRLASEAAALAEPALALDLETLARNVERLETIEAHLTARIRWWNARESLMAARNSARWKEA
jgi:tetratricopeptide (TPR) repeat protein